MDRVQMYRHLYEKGMGLIKLQRGKKIPTGGQRIGGVTVRESWENLKLGKGDNAGILTGRISGIIVLDIDYAERFPKEYEIPDTFTVQSRKGYHHYYKLPGDEKDYRNRSRGSEGFDIRANGGYIVAPGSSVDSWNYRVVCGAEIAPAPAWLLEVALESANPSRAKRVVIPVVQPAYLSEELRQAYNGLLSPNTTKGKRSNLIWHILNQLVAEGLTDEEIISLFEAYPKGAGEKYFEKGGGRTGWLISQIEKCREELAERTVTPFEASNQVWVGMLYDDILKTFTTFAEEYGRDVSEGQRLAFRQVCNLLIGLLDNEHSGWYCIPLGVGSGKTEAIKHLIKFLYEHDTDRSYSIALSLEKISEIETVKDWLIEKGVSTDYFRIVHHKVEDDIAEVFSRLPRTPVVIHTHYKLKGTSYLSEYFLYKGNQRNLLIFDESMLSSMTSAERSGDIDSLLNRCLRSYELGGSLAEKFPGTSTYTLRR